jgi:hypothetical protein
MADFTSGSWYTAQVSDASYGIAAKGGTTPLSSVVFRVTDGPCKDRTIVWNNSKWEAANNVFTFMKLRTCGWKFIHPKTIKEDLLTASRDGLTVRIQAKFVEGENDRGPYSFWAVDKVMANNEAARQVSAPTQESDALMIEMMAEAAAADAEYRRGQSNESKDLKVGDPCTDCKEPLFRKDRYLTCKNGHDTIPF